ncbi:MAG: DUF2277 domain-containing protein [Granulosicoccus sp.]|nr:DUF2277 domain-containing protein [Granulosicoccus sp.]
MCRNIRTLFNFEPAANADEIEAAALQYVRKLSGFNTPSRANEQVFQQAVQEIASTSARLLDSLTTRAPAKNRAEELEKHRARTAARFSD